MITPNTTIRFLKVPFSPSQNNVLKFGNVATQITYMETKIVYTMSNCTYQREGDGEFIRVNKSVDELYNSNYVMFQNTNFSNKWFYAFIDRLEYLNPKVSRVYIKMDSYQSFQFDFTLEKSFIERQTFATDYYNTLHDTPSTGDLVSVFEYQKNLVGTFIVLFNSDPTVEDTTSSVLQYPLINNYSMPCYMAKFSTVSEMSNVVLAVSNKGRADRIQACYWTPYISWTGCEFETVPKGDLNIVNDNILFVHTVPQDSLFEDVQVNINYTPTFKKELAYPYAKLEVVDKITGRSIELDLSKFANQMIPTFRIYYTFTDRAEYKIVPMNYNGVTYSIENSLVIEPNTELPIFSNTYSKYLKDNKGTNLINGVMSVAGLVGSVVSGNVAGGVSSFANIASIVNADSVARKQPNQVSGIRGDSLEYVNFSPCIYFRLKVMDSDHMDIARNFWNAYGYPVRKIATYSNTNDTFNFVKTVGSNIVADTIPSEYQRELEQMFDNGVTIWNSNYLQYS